MRRFWANNSIFWMITGQPFLLKSFLASWMSPRICPFHLSSHIYCHKIIQNTLLTCLEVYVVMYSAFYNLTLVLSILFYLWERFRKTQVALWTGFLQAKGNTKSRVHWCQCQAGQRSLQTQTWIVDSSVLVALCQKASACSWETVAAAHIVPTALRLPPVTREVQVGAVRGLGLELGLS